MTTQTAATGLSWAFTEEQEMIRKMVREFVDKEVKPVAGKIDKEGQIPQELIDHAKELGLFGMPFPEEYGGAGAGEIAYCLQCEELGHGCGSLGGMIGAHISISGMSILLSGTAEQKKRWLPPMARGEKIGCFALTEPQAGSDAQNLATTAVKDGSHWVLNGQKLWITNAPIADLFIVFGVNDKSLKAHGGVTAFVVEKGTPGLTIGAVDEKMGLRAMHSSEIFFDNMRVPEENVLGRVGAGFLVALGALDHGRLSLAAGCIGAAKEMVDLSIAHAKERKTFGQPIIEHQAIQFMLSSMAATIYAMESMVYRTAWMVEQGQRIGREAAIVKWWCTEQLGVVIDTALQIHGGMGYMRELSIERYYRDARVYRIFEGTTEIQRLVIARDLARKGRY